MIGRFLVSGHFSRLLRQGCLKIIVMSETEREKQAEEHKLKGNVYFKGALNI